MPTAADLVRRFAAFALLGACLAVSGCGGDDSAEADSPVAGVGQARAGSVAPLAQCRDWIAGTEEERTATIEDIQAQLNQENSGGPTPGLPNRETYDLLERACANDFAYGFRLYKVYVRAAAFSAFAGDPPE